MADETIYNPGEQSYRTVAMKEIMKKFPELEDMGHFEFNAFIAQHPELQGMTEDYNVLGGMDVAKRIEPGSTWWSGNKGLSTMGGLYSLLDTVTHKDQDWKEGFSDWYRNMKGIAIQRDWNPWFMNIDPAEKDYYQGLFKKMNLDKRKLDQMNEWQRHKIGNLRSDRNVPGTPIVPMDRGRDEKIVPIHSPHGGGPGTGNKIGMSQGRDRGRTRERGETGQIAGGHHFNRGGLIDIPLSGRSRYI